MEHEDESASYLKLFNEGPHNYLLNNGEEVLNDGFPVESIFTEIGTEWPSEGFPILLSGPLITETVSGGESNIKLESDDIEQTLSDKTVVLSSIDKDRFILSNDTFLQFEEGNNSEENTITHVINGNTYAITYSQDYQEEHSSPYENNVEVIQLLDIDGSVTNIDKNSLNLVEENNIKNDLSNFYTEVTAKKCKFCNFLCLSSEEIEIHIKIKHNKQIDQMSSSKTLLLNNEPINNGTKMTSILNSNVNKEKFVMYLCSDCGEAYLNKDDLKQHMVNAHNLVQINEAKDNIAQKENNMDIQFPESNKNQKSHAAVNANILKKQQRSMKRVKCSVKGCTFRFAKDEFRKRHEECHVNGDKKRFMCPECKEKFSIWRICSMHLWKRHLIDVGLLSCPMCDKFKSNSSARVLTHMAIHNEEKPFLCTVCGTGFKQLSQLRNHQVVHLPPDKVSNCYTMKQCESCDRLFANAKSLKKHIKFVHEKFKPFSCNICGHQTSRKEMLEIHYRQHTGDKPFHCKYCDYKTGDRNCLRRHTMRHFGIAKYSCPHCNFQAIQSSNYKAHLANKHPGQSGKYSCDVCRYSTVNLESYSAHIKYHEFEKKNNAAKHDVEKNENQKVKEENVDNPSATDEDETQNCFLSNEHCEEAVDTGGITIPAELDMPMIKQ